MFTPILDNQPYAYSVGKFVCVGRNYAAHAQELNNPIPQSPILFIKPSDAAVNLAPTFGIPEQYGAVHHELEIAVLIGQKLTKANLEQVRNSIAGVGLGLDLTLRDLQDQLKSKSQPWELAKAFDGACPISHFVSVDSQFDWQDISIEMFKNNVLVQAGNSQSMLFPILPLIAHISQHFTLNPGDIIMTGTPAGVGPLAIGDHLQLGLNALIQVESNVTLSN
ncbi:MAG: fumarylacetoacetate hydrolase family protein [Venatoribacter sp.]